ncbi:MAG: hypothetical protein ACI30N_02240 [Muribaculaceae bacterium]
MAKKQPVFSRERIALLSVCLAAICAILWFATRKPVPAPPVPVVTAAPAVTPKAAPADTAKAKKTGRHKAAKTPKGYHPKARDYFKTPEEERAN